MLREHFRFLNQPLEYAGLIGVKSAYLWSFDTSLRHKGTNH